MFDKYLILEDSLRNVATDGQVTGFAFDARLGYYRGLGLSMIEDLAVTLDGEAVAAEAIRFDEGPGPLSLAEMSEAYDRRWEFGAVATITVLMPGGLLGGPHQLALNERLRISYLPFPLMAADSKTLELAQ